MSVIKDIVERRVNQTGVSEPVVVDPGLRPRRRRAAGRHRSGSGPQARRPDRPARFRPARQDAGRSQGQVLDLKQYAAALQRRPGLVGDGRHRPERPPLGRLRAEARRRASSSPTTPRSTSATTSPSPSTRASSPRRSSRTRSPTARSRSPAAAWRVHRARTPRPRHRPEVRFAAVPDPGALDASRSARRSAASSSIRACSPAPSGSCWSSSS